MQRNEDRISYWVKQIDVALRRDADQRLERLNLTRAQMEVLIHLENSGADVTQRDIESYFNLTNPTVTGLINRLESKGLIIRVANPSDARSRFIRLTDRSRDILRDGKVHISSMDNAIASGMTDAELSELLRMLRLVHTNIIQQQKQHIHQ